MSAPGKLLLISDLEGCNAFGPPPVKAPQSQVICGQEFFDSIASFLGNAENKVAFLGDYFDQGPMVVDSVNRIIDLQGRFAGQVTIILGNRDINKLRLIYELRPVPQVTERERWLPVWRDFYDAISTTIPIKERLKLILNKSMGAPAAIPQMDSALTEDEACFLLVSAFSEPAANALINAAASADSIARKSPKYAQFVENVRKLFKIGKIVSYDADFKTLLSHAGGTEPFILHDKAYYDTIKSSLASIPAYYDKIETVRIRLQDDPASKVAVYDETTYNEPLAIIPTIFDDANEPSPDFFLLQGLGLKPNAGRHFNSFIQSCDIQGCKGPYADDIAMDPPLEYRTFLSQLKTTDIRFIAHGHVPHCVPIPLIYKRQEGDIIFVANDTSNGYRPADISNVNQVPLSYITKDGKAGVFSLPGSTDNTYNAGSMFSSMIKEWDLASCPVFAVDLPLGPRVQYSDGRTLTFPARSPPNGPFTAAKMVGGTRKRKARKNIKGKSRRQRR